MRIRNVPGSRFGQELYFEKGEIDQICEDELRKAQMLPASPEPIRIERFVEKHFECRLVYEDIADGVLGCTAFKMNGGIALVSVSPSLDDGTDTGRRRSRSTAAHEAGHCALHPILFMGDFNQLELAYPENLDFKGRRIMCRSKDFAGAEQRGYDGRWWEVQANRAIGGFLLPRKLIATCVAPFLQNVGRLGLAVLPADARPAAERHVAQVFDVNPIVARIRLSDQYPEAAEAML